VEAERLEDKLAHKDDVKKTHQDVGDDDLKSLIARALGTAPADDR
jgi:hypothetical protein